LPDQAEANTLSMLSTISFVSSKVVYVAMFIFY